MNPRTGRFAALIFGFGFALVCLAGLAPVSAHAELSAEIKKAIQDAGLKPEECQASGSEGDPDRPSGTMGGKSRLVPPGITAIQEVMIDPDTQAETNAAANNGAISYFSKSVSNEDQFFSAAYHFYKALKNKDNARLESTFQLTPIQEAATFDVLQLAMSSAGGNPYLAFKLMAIFGHDNLQNSLVESKVLNACRSRFINSLKPDDNSTLYLNSAIGALKYTRAQIKEGREIAAACGKIKFDALNLLCNDSIADYQGDYYHVIMSAFLGCRRKIADQTAVSVWPSSLVGETVIDQFYLNQVRKYKTDRFEEELHDHEEEFLDMDPSEPEPSEDGIRINRVLKMVRISLERIKAGKKPALESFAKFCGNKECTRKEYDTAQAISHRHEFEVNFRVAQHKMGMEFGRKLCKDMTSYSLDSGIQKACP